MVGKQEFTVRIGMAKPVRFACDGTHVRAQWTKSEKRNFLQYIASCEQPAMDLETFMCWAQNAVVYNPERSKNNAVIEFDGVPFTIATTAVCAVCSDTDIDAIRFAHAFLDVWTRNYVCPAEVAVHVGTFPTMRFRVHGKKVYPKQSLDAFVQYMRGIKQQEDEDEPMTVNAFCDALRNWVVQNPDRSKGSTVTVNGLPRLLEGDSLDTELGALRSALVADNCGITFVFSAYSARDGEYLCKLQRDDHGNSMHYYARTVSVSEWVREQKIPADRVERVVAYLKTTTELEDVNRSEDLIAYADGVLVVPLGRFFKHPVTDLPHKGTCGVFRNKPYESDLMGLICYDAISMYNTYTRQVKEQPLEVWAHKLVQRVIAAKRCSIVHASDKLHVVQCERQSYKQTVQQLLDFMAQFDTK